jgi:hypothetical protein
MAALMAAIIDCSLSVVPCLRRRQGHGRSTWLGQSKGHAWRHPLDGSGRNLTGQGNADSGSDGSEALHVEKEDGRFGGDG